MENMYDQNVVQNSIATHTKTFGTEPTTISYAPGRIEVLGNHTDYNEGTVLSAAINMGHCFCIFEIGRIRGPPHSGRPAQNY
jgi:galactokinase